ncbi:calcium-binding and coiled-coil domain-containing protein 2-like [Ipomoea triloba]|uniref:calcium-binding and coiled-coil domain-containing protein 2-like n=1 Tax=Ipomoea triloba TaxID=35885 RepID=UPI00125DE6FF|nr:calcium-binding and coiled-coil domain-containing protein 2-like [Ipomoea triloba]
MELDKVHNVFHVSQLKRYVPDASHILKPEELEMDDSLVYEEKPIQILDSKTRDTRRKLVKMIKVQWSNHSFEEATWELESVMREREEATWELESVMRERYEATWELESVMRERYPESWELESVMRERYPELWELESVMRERYPELFNSGV